MNPRTPKFKGESKDNESKDERIQGHPHLRIQRRESMDTHIQNEQKTKTAANGTDDNRLGVTRWASHDGRHTHAVNTPGSRQPRSGVLQSKTRSVGNKSDCYLVEIPSSPCRRGSANVVVPPFCEFVCGVAMCQKRTFFKRHVRRRYRLRVPTR
jgi:hypothetical protein